MEQEEEMIFETWNVQEPKIMVKETKETLHESNIGISVCTQTKKKENGVENIEKEKPHRFMTLGQY